MSLATLSIDIVAQIANLQAGLDKAGRLAEKQAAHIEAQYAKLNAAASTVGRALGAAFAGVSVGAFVKQTVDAIDALNDAADATGATVESLSGLEDVARRNGGTLDDVTGILVKFNGVLKEADGKNGVSQVLKRIGLDAAELRKLDPAEALQRTAVALNGVAADGDKARAVQELFGKSIREAAPLLKDLAEAGQLNASVTADQAAEAEKFNKHLFALQTGAGNLGRELVLSVVPALNEMIDRIRGVNSAASESGGLGAALLVPLETVAVLGTNVAYVFKTIGKEIGGMAAQAAALARGDFAGIAEIRRGMVAEAAADRAEVDRRSAQLMGLSPQQQQLAGVPQASYSNEGRNAVRRIGDFTGSGKSPKEPKFRLGAADLLAKEFGGDLAKLLAKDGPLADPSSLISVTDALSGFTGEMQRLNEMLGDTATAKLEQQRADMQLLAQAYREGRITVDQFSEAAATRLGNLPAEIKPAVDQMTEVTKEFQRNVQDILGDGVESVLKGDFDSIGSAFGNMLRKMAAQAAAADLGNLILGKMGANGVRSGGALDGIFGSLLGSLFGFAKGGAFSGGVQAFATGGVVGGPSLFGMSGGRLGLMGEAGPEAIMPLKRGADGKLGVAAAGGSTTIINNNVAAGVTRNELMSALQMMRGSILGETQAMMRRQGMA